MKKIILIAIFSFIISINLIAQKNGDLKQRKVEITFGYPIGTSGIHSMNYTYNLSLNLLYGLSGGINGFQISSMFNYTQTEIKGFQLSGVSNINSGKSKGFLLSGGFNYSGQNSKGFQLAPINIAKNDIIGLQLGVLNYAGKIEGIQLGIVNILNNGKGAFPIGIISIVKNGYYELEFVGGEVIYSNLNYKMGVEKLYSIYKTGYSTYKNRPIYSFGFGFGCNLPIKENNKISIDISRNFIVYDNNWKSKTNLIDKLDISYKLKLSDKISFLIGPSFNSYYTKEQTNGEYGTLNIPYSIYNIENENYNLSMWIGLNAGLAIKM